MNSITFADVVHQSLSFSPEIPAESLVLQLLDTRWVQRLRDISQTANTRLVYMFSEHSRFGHSLGVAYLANVLMSKLESKWPEEIKPWRAAVNTAALLHDLGHIAPGSHMAFKTWFPNLPDCHEKIGIKIIDQDPELGSILNKFDSSLISKVGSILNESESVPPWTWQIISGGGWNVDRGNWCAADSILAGVSYGKYNIPALIESIVLTPDKHLALKENRLDSMLHFAVSRHAMYRQIYQHRVILAADVLARALVQRAREINGKLCFIDETMNAVLNAKSAEDLSLESIFAMTESWWKYHLSRWTKDSDKIISDLSGRILDRRLLKTVRIRSIDDSVEVVRRAEEAVRKCNYDPRFYLHTISTQDMHSSDFQQSMLVLHDDGSLRPLNEADPLLSAMVKESPQSTKTWLAMPAEAKSLLGRER